MLEGVGEKEEKEEKEEQEGEAAGEEAEVLLVTRVVDVEVVSVPEVEIDIAPSLIFNFPPSNSNGLALF